MTPTLLVPGRTQREKQHFGTAPSRAVPAGTEVSKMENEDMSGGKAAATMAEMNAEWERRKARALRSLQEAPLDRWLRRRS